MLPLLAPYYSKDSYYFYYTNSGLCTFFQNCFSTILVLDHNMVEPHLIVFADCNYYNLDAEYYCSLDNFDNHL